jgi:2,4-dichlorophenol 6-monooxygenase
MQSMPTEKGCDTDVLIVGTGPTGAATALALASYGIRCHMISRWNWLADSPRAHIINQRTMEVFRDLGIESEVQKSATPWEFMGDTLFTTSLAGQELVRLRTWGTGDERKSDYLKASPCGLVDIIQPTLEPILFKNAAERGAAFAFNTEYLSHEQDTHGVSARLKDRLTDREFTMRAKYLVGADGAKSSVAAELGLAIEGQMARAGTTYITFNADLTRFVQHRPSMLYWIAAANTSFGEIGMGLLRSVRPWTQWIAGWGFDIEKGPDLSESTVRSNISALIGDSDVEVQIVKSSVWYVNQAYATTYSKGRVFCGGDAVHRHPPTNGLGLNTCVQDAFNLAWKIAFVLKGYAGDELLESYTLERAPVGQQIVQRANQSRIDYSAMNACFRVTDAPDPLQAGIARFRDPGPAGVAARREVLHALDLKNGEFNAQGVEMNQRYQSAAILQDAGSLPEQWSRDPQLYVQPTTRPGAKLPHVWLIDRHGKRISILDVVGKGLFSLITGLSGTAWVIAAKELALPYLRVITVGEPDAADVYCEWQRAREIEEAGALLVRPDGYVAWREVCAIHLTEIARQKLATVLSLILEAPR